MSQNDHLGLLESLRLPHARFLPLLADLTTYYRCGSELAWRDRDVVIFHPSHHDWTYNLGNRNSAKGNNKYRNSSKGNDRLIRAVARHVQNGTNCYLVMIEHGIDVFESKKLVNELGIDSHVQWLKPVTAAELRHLYCSADVVADQFDVGTPGLICLDALACGARVMCYIDENTARRAFGDLPPVFNCRSEDSIFEAIGQVQHQVWTEEDAVRSRAWVESHNGPDLVLRELRDVYVNAIN